MLEKEIMRFNFDFTGGINDGIISIGIIKDNIRISVIDIQYNSKENNNQLQKIKDEVEKLISNHPLIMEMKNKGVIE